MVEAGQLPPTRTTLLRLRQDVAEANRGHSLLERKREVLQRELRGLIFAIRHDEKEVRERFETAYDAVREARLAMGSERLRWAALAPVAETTYGVGQRSVMGVDLPQVHWHLEPLHLPYSPYGVSSRFDEVRERWLEVGRDLGGWIESIGAIWRIAAELDRTQRRVNALEHVLIPELRGAIRHIESVLEEQEREAFTRAKRVKKQREAP
jgi:V/A-type H+-transporting ATPase subunit D